jgi:hypothetical protein
MTAANAMRLILPAGDLQINRLTISMFSANHEGQIFRCILGPVSESCHDNRIPLSLLVRSPFEH